MYWLINMLPFDKFVFLIFLFPCVKISASQQLSSMKNIDNIVFFLIVYHFNPSLIQGEQTIFMYNLEMYIKLCASILNTCF